MKRLLAALVVVLACSQSDAGWTLYQYGYGNPALAQWYATYTVIINGTQYRTYTPANVDQCHRDLAEIKRQAIIRENQQHNPANAAAWQEAEFLSVFLSQVMEAR